MRGILNLVLFASINILGMEQARSELPTFLDPVKIKNFLAQSPNTCAIAFGEVSGKEGAITQVYCVWGGVQEPGTINEAQGCMLGKYDVRSGGYLELMPPQYHSKLLTKDTINHVCDKETVMKIVKEIPLGDYGYYDSGDSKIKKLPLKDFAKKITTSFFLTNLVS